MPVINRVAAMQEEVAAWRQDFHQHPEIGFEVHRTAGIVAEKLEAFGCDEVVPGIGKTGVVGIIKGRKSASGKVVGLRADMDALPIQEATGLRLCLADRPARCTPAATTGTPPCCSAPPSTCARRATSTARCASSSSRTRRA